MSDLEDKLAKITEKQFSQQVADVAKTFGWLVYRTWNSQHSPKGFPDLCMVKGPLIIFAELKSKKGKTTPAQEQWLNALEYTPADVYLWRPGDLEEIIEVLR